MKLSIKHLVFVSMLSVLAVGCGKSDSKGGSRNDNFNGSNSNNVVSGVQAQTNYVDWLSAAETRTLLSQFPLIRHVEATFNTPCTKLLCFDFDFGSNAPRYVNSTLTQPLVNGQIRSSYAGVQRAITPASGFALAPIQQQGNFFIITHVRLSDSRQIVFVLDMTLHVGLQPRKEIDYVNGRAKELLGNY